MFHPRVVLLSGLAAVFVAAAAAADEKTAEEALAAKGLRRITNRFTLPEETELGKLVRATDALKRKVVDAEQAAEAAEQRVRQKENLITTYLQQRSLLRVQLQRAKTVEQYNAVITAMEELADRVVVLEKREDEERAAKAARAAANSAREEFIQHILDTRKLFDKAQEKYADLAADPKVAEAIKEYNDATGKSYELGPSASLTSNGRRLEKLEESVLSEDIPLRQGRGDLWFVSVMFNGKYTQEISIDTGSTVIAIPWTLAEKMGVTPGSDAPVVKCRLADGRVIEAQQIFLESVRVGKFTVENVEAAVFPKEATGAEPLLGLSFLEHFSYKIDTGKSKLVMVRVETSADRRRRPQ